MAIIRQICQLGHKTLRADNKLVENINDHIIQSIIDDMLITVEDANGVGIAAPQIFESYKIFIIASRSNPRYPYAPNLKPFALINPEIIDKDESKEKGWEGCLSIPGIRGLVPRYKSLKVRYLNRKGNTEETVFKDFIARIFQHEYDHIHGLVYLDRLDSVQDIITEKEYLKIVNS